MRVRLSFGGLTLLAPALVGIVLCASPAEKAPAAPSDDELSAAFDAPKPAAVKAPATPPDHNVVQPPAPEDPLVPLRAEFAQAFAAAKARVGANDLAGARKALPEVEKLALQVGPPETLEARELAFHAADKKGAPKLAERWLLACGPEDVEPCRAKALAALPKARAAPFKSADDCLRGAEARLKDTPSKAPACLDKALPVFRKSKDFLMVASVQLLQGLFLAADPKKTAAAQKGLEQAQKTCAEPRCVQVRRRALRELVALHLREEKPEPAARAALSELALLTATLPPARRPYVRTPTVDTACAALDKASGKGACRRLEKSLNGRYTFQDFSQTVLRNGLPQDQMAQVNEHYGVLIEACLAAEAARLVPPDSAIYRVRWMVLNDGRVDAVHVDGADNGPLAACLREQFGTWRYPIYQGEWQHVEQSFAIRASSRR